MGKTIWINQLPRKTLPHLSLRALESFLWDLARSCVQGSPACRVCRVSIEAFGKKHEQTTGTLAGSDTSPHWVVPSLWLLGASSSGYGRHGGACPAVTPSPAPPGSSSARRVRHRRLPRALVKCDPEVVIKGEFSSSLSQRPTL